MERTAHARALLAQLAARRFGRPVAISDLVDALRETGMSRAIAVATVEEIISDRSAYEHGGGLLPGAVPLASRAPTEVASSSWLHR